MDFKKYLEEKLKKDPKFKELYERKDFENLKIDIGNMVERERILNRMKQKDLAKKIGTSQSYISRLENFSISPSLKTLQKIAETFGGFIDIKISYKQKEKQLNEIKEKTIDNKMDSICYIKNNQVFYSFETENKKTKILKN